MIIDPLDLGPTASYRQIKDYNSVLKISATERRQQKNVKGKNICLIEDQLYRGTKHYTFQSFGSGLRLIESESNPVKTGIGTMIQSSRKTGPDAPENQNQTRIRYKPHPDSD